MIEADQESAIVTVDERESEENFDEFICKVEQVLSLILGEIKKIDATIHRITHSEGKQEFLPTIEENKEFSKSTNKDNAQVCRGIICDLKKQRHEINEMLEFYNVCTQEFSKLEDYQKRQSKEIEEMRNTLDGLTEFLDRLEYERSNRSKNFNEERKYLKVRDKSHERLFNKIVEWISELNKSQLREETKENSRIAKLEAERNEDRAMLMSVVKQIQEVNQIKSISGTNGLPDKTAGPTDSKNKIGIAGENVKQFPSNEFCSEIEIGVTNLEKPKKSIKKKNLFPKITQKNREKKGISDFETSERQKNLEINHILSQSCGCQNPIFLGKYNSVKNYLFRKDIPFYLKLIGRQPERNKIKFMTIGDWHFNVE